MTAHRQDRTDTETARLVLTPTAPFAHPVTGEVSPAIGRATCRGTASLQIPVRNQGPLIVLRLFCIQANLQRWQTQRSHTGAPSNASCSNRHRPLSRATTQRRIPRA